MIALLDGVVTGSHPTGTTINADYRFALGGIAEHVPNYRSTGG
jgi:hypothetical protein